MKGTGNGSDAHERNRGCRAARHVKSVHLQSHPQAQCGTVKRACLIVQGKDSRTVHLSSLDYVTHASFSFYGFSCIPMCVRKPFVPSSVGSRARPGTATLRAALIGQRGPSSHGAPLNVGKTDGHGILKIHWEAPLPSRNRLNAGARKSLKENILSRIPFCGLIADIDLPATRIYDILSCRQVMSR